MSAIRIELVRLCRNRYEDVCKRFFSDLGTCTGWKSSKLGHENRKSAAKNAERRVFRLRGELLLKTSLLNFRKILVGVDQGEGIFFVPQSSQYSYDQPADNSDQSWSKFLNKLIRTNFKSLPSSSYISNVVDFVYSGSDINTTALSPRQKGLQVRKFFLSMNCVVNNWKQ